METHSIEWDPHFKRYQAVHLKYLRPSSPPRRPESRPSSETVVRPRLAPSKNVKSAELTFTVHTHLTVSVFTASPWLRPLRSLPIVIDMRLVFSTTNHMNTDLSDERGLVQYSISTPSGTKKVTTITKYHWSGSTGVPETMGVIEWHRLKETVFRFNGEVVPANTMLAKQTWKTGRYFVGPDQQTYKWKIESTYCWMKSAKSDEELVRFHKKNLGILKPAHPAYLRVSPNAVSMLDHIILTFIYVEWLRQEQTGSQKNFNDTGNINSAIRKSGTAEVA